MSVLVKVCGQLASSMTMIPNANNLLSLIVGVLDFLIHPLTIFGVGSYQYDDCARPINARLQNLPHNVAGISSIIGLVAIYRSVAHVTAVLSKEVFQRRKPVIIFVDVADEDIA